METLIPWIDPALFTFYLWRGGSIGEVFLFPCREKKLIQHREILLRYATGYCYGTELFVRAKPKTYAIMFEGDSFRFWGHLRPKEFESIFIGSIN